jgi:hypothetical protein
VAALLSAILLAGAPGILFAFRAPTRDEVDLIRERQQIVLQRLAVLEAQNEELQADITDLRFQLQQHFNQGGQ